MNKWDAVKAVQKYSRGLDELIYYFEENPGKEKGSDEVKALYLVLPLPIAITFPFLSPIVAIGRQFGVNFDIVDIERLKIESKDAEFVVWNPYYKPVYIVKCTEEDEVKSALEKLKKAKRALNTYLKKINRTFYETKGW